MNINSKNNIESIETNHTISLKFKNVSPLISWQVGEDYVVVGDKVRKLTDTFPLDTPKGLTEKTYYSFLLEQLAGSGTQENQYV